MSEVFYYLVGKVLSGEATASEREELNTLLRSNEELRQLYETLFAQKITETEEDALAAEQAFAAHAVRLQIEGELEQSKQWQEAEAAAEPPQRKIRKIGYWAAAACMAAVVLASFVWYYQAKDITVVHNRNEVVTRKGSKSHITLPDGTTVWLNGDSKLSYEGNFGKQTREVVLTGEAYFDVTKDKKRPFIIHTGALEVKVLGTAFNIRSYADEHTIETSLIHGAIEVTLKSDPAQKIFLKPNDKLVVSNPALPVGKSVAANKSAANAEELPLFTLKKISFHNSDSVSTEASWVENKLAFDNEPFETAALKMERWYNVEFRIKNEALKGLRFTGEFEHKSLQDVLEALQVSRSFQFSITDETVTIW
jgi:ferric-dicitrate binding protein FerR (iron transport regulator)